VIVLSIPVFAGVVGSSETATVDVGGSTAPVVTVDVGTAVMPVVTKDIGRRIFTLVRQPKVYKDDNFFPLLWIIIVFPPFEILYGKP